MKYFVTLILAICMSSVLQAQDVANKIYDQVDQVATYPGGAGAWNLYLSNNFRYPENAKAAKEQGTVVLSFVVETSGKITNLKIEESVSPALDENSAYMLYKGGAWQPALVDGKPVRSRVTLPVHYQL